MTSPASVDPPAQGAVIAGKYRLDSLLGVGGMGSVWRAYNLQLEVPVALKLLRTDLGVDDLGERLRVEARAAAKLAHPSIIRVYDIGEAESGDPFIVMELLVGESLASVLERGPLSAASAVGLLLPIAEALSLAHAHGVVHRDLKPDNIFLATEGARLQPKLVDFGIAKLTSPQGGGRAVTQTGTLLGSPDYMSPEQAYGRTDIDERSDIWSFCIVLYEAIAGRPPFVGPSCQHVLRSVVRDPAPPLSTFADVDPELARLIESGLAKDREQRPASIFSLAQQLAAWLWAQGIHEDVTGSAVETKWLGRQPTPKQDSLPSIEVPHARRRGWPSAAALATLTLGGFWLTTHARPSPITAQPVVVEAAAASPVVALDAAAGPPIVALDALPLQPGPSSKVAPAVTHPKETVLAAMPPTSAVPPKPHPSVKAPAPSPLPQAIPARNSRAELLNPY